ncbi:MarR family transcriptional regulator [Microbacterium betulae]|uniref:MarR family transcriptional regulator n=1 Tax=Microbacterium betulae TaxID=2981139 RepID=A0AA97FFZ3_9MICO|nr:MarR family transcriptional regulator [Microbacterium sp. AB]WOF22836.1 MarR family transcriptional regulator [Microbacterium sp. AB]
MAASRQDRSAQLADLAHFILSVARDVRLYGHFDPEILEVTELESLVMDHVQRHPGVSPSGICAEVGLRSSNASAVLRSLEERGMIERVPNPADRRSVSVHPTPVAARNLERVRQEWARFLAPHVDDDLDLAPVIALLGSLDESVTRAASPSMRQTA